LAVETESSSHGCTSQPMGVVSALHSAGSQ
jgi:hypothetical protein